MRLNMMRSGNDNWKIKRVSRKTAWLDSARLVGRNVDRIIPIEKKEHYFDRNNLPPWAIEWVEPISLADPERRGAAIQKAGYNTFLLRSEDVYLDFLTDSGTSAMSDYQWDGLERGDEAYAGSWNFETLEKAVRDAMGYPYVVPTHQGRAAEHLISRILIKPGQFVPNNMYFTTRRLHQEMAGGVWMDFVADEAHDPESEYPFKGNWDLDKLEDFLKKTPREKIAALSCEAALNMAGGQPFSLENLRGLRRLSQKYGVPLWLDATRIFCNAYQIKEREKGYENKSVREIAREICGLTDFCTISAKKDAAVNIGGFIASFDEDIFQKAREMVVVYEGLHTYGGLAGRDLEAMARGLEEFSLDEEVGFYVRQNRRFGEALIKAGIPVAKPIGAHAVFIDAKRFLPHLDQQKDFLAQTLSAEIYAASGIRTMERGIVSGQHGDERYDGLELVRVTIPRRVYTDRHFDYAVGEIAKLYEKRSGITGLTLTYSPKSLRFFQATFEKK